MDDSFSTLLDLNATLIPVILVNCALAIILLLCAKIFSTFTFRKGYKGRITFDSNPAYGIHLGGMVVAIIIIITGVMSNEAALDLDSQIMMSAGYGVLGIVLLMFTHWLFDRVDLPHFSMRKAVVEGNLSAAIVDACNLLSTAIIIRAVMFWSNSYMLEGLGLILSAYVVSQILITIASHLRIRHFKGRHGMTLEDALQQENLAAAWQFGGFSISQALAITAASELIPYAYDAFLQPLFMWVVLSVIFSILVSVLSMLADKVLMSGINIQKQVDQRGNVAIGVVQASLHIAMGLLVVSLVF